MEALIVYLIVACCTAYGLHRLLPAVTRRLIAGALHRSGLVPAPVPSERKHEAARGVTCGSGCNGCGETRRATASTPLRKDITQ